jgi:hypothetical protein
MPAFPFPGSLANKVHPGFTLDAIVGQRTERDGHPLTTYVRYRVVLC